MFRISASKMMLITVILFVIYLIFLYTNSSKRRRQIDQIPGPRALPILGNLLDVGNNSVSILKNLARLATEYGPMYRLWLGPTTAFVVISGAKQMEEILSKNAVVDKGDFYRYLEEWIGNAFPVCPAQRWLGMRKIIAPAFNAISLDKYMPHLNRNANRLVKNIKSMEFGKEGKNIFHYISACGLENVCHTMLSEDLDYKTKEGYFQGLRVMTHITVHRLFSPFYRFDKIYRYTKKYQAQRAAVEKMNTLVDILIARKKEDRLQNDNMKQTKTALDMLLDLSEADSTYTYKNIRYDINSIVAAGFETVSTALNFGVYHLSKRPDIQRKAFEEIEAILGDDNDITAEQLHQMKYLECVHKEILRLFCSVPMIERTLREDITVDGKIIPKGTVLILFIYGLHHDGNVYPEPDKFDPERFLPENSAERSFYAFLPYSAGKRNCIGIKFAQLEAKIILCNIIRNFEIIAVEPEHKPVLCMEVALKSTNGLPVIMKPRQKIIA